MAVYECERDYWLNGPGLRICSNNAQWSGEKPFCEIISCGQPEIPVEELLQDTASRFIVKYITIVDCGRVPAVIKGEVIYEDEDTPTFLDSRVHYKCMPNFRLIGNEIRVCLKSGRWSSDSPKCEEIRCKEPEHPDRSRLTVTGNDRRVSLAITRSRHNAQSNTTYKVGSQITYRCERGFVIDGISVRTCLNNDIDCGVPPAVERGTFRLLSNETSYGSVVSYECEENWKVDGRVRRHCLENGTWSGDFPKCVEVLCPSLSAELQRKYKEEDEKEIEPWNKALLERKEKERKLRIDVDEGSRRVGSFATYKCNKGQKVVGEVTRNCKQHGVWDGSEPKCEWVYCDKPQNIENVDDRDIGGFDDNSLTESSNLSGGPLDESYAGASYTWNICWSCCIILSGFRSCISFYFISRHVRKKLAKPNSNGNSSSSNGHSPPSKPIDPPPYPMVMTYGDLNDPTTGNNIYEHIPDDFESSSYANMSPTSSFNSTPPNSYSNLPIHTYSNTGRELNYPPYINNSSLTTGKPPSDRSSVSRRPRMPPPQPPSVTPSSAGVTVNGVAVNTS
ncbi:CUB and sushi domain-containing protein 1 [Armadillidium vulgare]|nr:CUB and sushi domain-containing protein 1 [Armadillidium vulgare]